MSIAAGMTRMGRVQAEALMESMCTITRTGARVLGDDGLYTDATTTVYAGRCKLKQGTTQVSQVEAAGQLLISQDSILSLPVATSGAVRAGDIVTLTALGLDPASVGSVFRIKGPHAQTFSTARRFPVENP